MRHFYQQVSAKHKVRVSYNWLRLMLQEAGVVEKEPVAARAGADVEHQPMVGMLVYLDSSTHEWIAGLPRHDLIIALDDAVFISDFNRRFTVRPHTKRVPSSSCAS